MVDVPRVFAPGKRIAQVGETEIYLLTVELWGPGEVTVRLVGASDDRMRARIARYEADIRQWAPDREYEHRPQSPGEELCCGPPSG